MEKVIFDTNAYRYLVTKTKTKHLGRLVNKLKSREKQHGIQALMSSVVAKELLYHAANPQDSSYLKCLKGASAMYQHCSDDNGKGYRMIASSELLMSKAFFNLEIPKKVETNKAIGQMLFHLSEDPSLYTLNKLQRNLSLNRKHVKESEDVFVAELKGLMKGLDPNIDGWQPHKSNQLDRTKLLTQIRSSRTSLILATAYLSIVAQLLIESGQLTLESAYDGLQDKASQFLKWFPAPIALYKEVLENMVESEFDLTKKSRSNFVWDIQLMFNIGSHQIEDGSLYFVTDDKAMTRAAKASNAELKVFTFDEYMELLGMQANLHILS